MLLTGTVFSDWPLELTKPVVTPKEEEVPVLTLEQTNGRSTYNTDNLIFLIKEDSLKRLTQKVEYSFYDDFPLQKKQHYLNLEGEFLKKQFPFKFMRLGLDWAPSFSIDKHSLGGIAVGSFKLGPVMEISYNTLPIRVFGGGALDLWHDSLSAKFHKTDIDGLNADGGGYVGATIGDNEKELFPGIPFFAEGEIYGTYMSNSNITSGLINGLFIKDLNVKNQLSIYAADTLSKGRLANYTSGNFGTVDYTSSYDRTSNDFRGMVGFRRLSGFLLQPAILYSLDISTMNYPYSNKALDEYREISNKATIFLENSKRKIVGYNGWMSFRAVDYDVLYQSKLSSSGETGPNDYKDPNEKYDSLVANEDDMEGRYVNLFNRFFINLFNRGDLIYSMDLERYKKIYPNVYTYYDTRETTINNRDEIKYKHDIDFHWNFNKNLLWGVGFNYRKDMTIYYNPARSASNTINREYKLETTLTYESDRGSFIKEHLGALNDQQEFPDYVEEFLKEEFYAGNDLSWRPENSRKLYSRLDMKLVLKPWISLSGSWYETFFDNGYWDIETWKYEYGLGTGNYVVQSKNIESEGIGIIEISPLKNHKYLFGANAKNVISKYYNLKAGKWQQEHLHKYFIDFNPFVEFRVLLRNRLLLVGNIKRNAKLVLSTENDSYNIKSSDGGFWEAGTSLEVYF